MLAIALFFLLGMLRCVSSAAVHAERQAQSISTAAASTCPVTLVSYVTVTVTDTPPTVTIVVPDYTSIAASLARASTIDSIVVVEQSQNAPISAPINTVIPAFTHTIVAPAFEATEAASNNSKSPFYVSVSRNATLTGRPPASNVILGVTTVSIFLRPVNSTQEAAPTTTISSTVRITSTVRKPFSSSLLGWNGTTTGGVRIDATGTAASSDRRPVSLSTVTTYIATKTVTASTTITAAPVAPSSLGGAYGSPDFEDSWTGSDLGKQKRQTCVLISALFGETWATWCNNWDGKTALTYTSWQTTVTPGQGSGVETSLSSVPVSQASGGLSPTTPSASPPTIPAASATDSGAATSSETPAIPAAPSVVSGCGELGVFDVNFDTLPKQSATNENAGFPPIFSPYNHFFWAESWSYVPPPQDPYPPQSGSLLAISNPQSQNIAATSAKGLNIPDGGFGAGPRESLSAYWFNARWAYVGCQTNVADPSGGCDFVAQGYRYDTASAQSQLYVTQHFYQPLCLSQQCPLQQIVFNNEFNNLTTLRFSARIGNLYRTLYIDSIRMDWVDNNCTAGITRASSRK